MAREKILAWVTGPYGPYPIRMSAWKLGCKGHWLERTRGHFAARQLSLWPHPDRRKR